MKKNKIVGVLLLIWAVSTAAGIVVNSDTYWNIYNYTTIVFSLISGVILLKQK